MSTGKKWAWLPEEGSRGYYGLLVLFGSFLGMLGGVTASYMNFSLGFFVGGQVLAGILGSSIIFLYDSSENKHAANYMQTMAASVAGMSGMCVLIQAMKWLDIPQPPAWHLITFFTCIGMFGCGIGMMYTPILVDKMKLTYPSGLAVAGILRALTDKILLKQSIGKLGTGTVVGILGGLASSWVKAIEGIGLSTSTLGAGMIVGARIGIPAIGVAIIGDRLTTYFVKIGWLDEGEPYRKILFLIALGAILGAAVISLGHIIFQAARQYFTARKNPPTTTQVEDEPDWKKTDKKRLMAWTVCWAIALFAVATQLLQLPPLYVAIAMGLVLIFILINGISTGISDSNPISSAFVVTVFIIAMVGLRDLAADGESAHVVNAMRIALFCGAILLISTSAGVDMQQDRSTGWRLKTNRTLQFRFQVGGILLGAVMTVVFARLFMNAYPILEIDTYTNQGVEGAGKWQSAMTFKFAGAIRGIVKPKGYITTALQIGLAIGFVTELLRKLIKGWERYQKWVKSGKMAYAADFILDTVVLPSPYASSFGGFVEFNTSLWFGLGGIMSSYAQTLHEEGKAEAHKKVTDAPDEAGSEVPNVEADVVVPPEDMSTNGLIGGGLIAGDALAALGLGLYGLFSTLGG